MKTVLAALSVGVVVAAGACGDERAAQSVVADAGPPAGCNPIVGDDCLTPYPSSFQEVTDSSTRTGYRVHIDPSVMPESNAHVQVRPDRINTKDGFSPATPFIVYFAAGVDVSQLPTHATAQSTLLPTSPVQIIDMATGERILCFAEIDANAGLFDRQALLIHPLVRLSGGHRYAIALVGMRDAAGAPLLPVNFAKLRDKTELSGELEPLAARYEDIFTVLATAGVARESLSLAWDVVIASDLTATEHLTTMRDYALDQVAKGALTYTIDKVTDFPDDPSRYREIFATMQAPNYLLANDDVAAFMRFDDDGQPEAVGTFNFPVTIEIPRCAATATKSLPYVVFGHGLFGTAKDFLESGTLLKYGNDLCMVLIGTDYIGLATVDLPAIVNNVLVDFNNINIVTDHLQQAHVNQTVLTRMFRTKMKDDPALAIAGKPITDGSEVYYLGASLGGIEGGVYMGLQKDVVRGVLNVPGADWNLILFRSYSFGPVELVLNIIYPDHLTQQLIVAMSQSEFDYVDPLNFAGHLIHDPLPGTPVKHILVQQSMNDSLVPNMTTELLVRTIGLPGLDLEQPVFGVIDGTAQVPLDSAYTQWDIKPMPIPPLTNTPSDDDNGAHGGIQEIPALITQIVDFLTPTGQIVRTCNGPCIFPGGH